MLYTLYCLTAVILVTALYIFFPIILFPIFSSKIRSSVMDEIDQLPPKTRFIVIIPAHNEAAVIETVLRSIQQQNYPAELIEAVVIADNCSDRTATIAKDFQCKVFENTTVEKSNKLKALNFGFEKMEAADMLHGDQKIGVIIDADSLMDKQFLRALDYRYQKAQQAPFFQCFRSVQNRTDSSIATLDAASEAIRQWVQLGVREQLGWNGFLHGSGTAFPLKYYRLLMKIEMEKFADDKLWKIQLLKEGIPVFWCPEAKICYRTVSTNQSFSQQRYRWITGQFILAKKYALPIMFQGMRERNISKLDFACSLLQIPRGFFFLLTVVLLLLNLLSYQLLWINIICLSVCFLFLIYGAIGLRLANADKGIWNILQPIPKLILDISWSSLKSIFGIEAIKW